MNNKNLDCLKNVLEISALTVCLHKIFCISICKCFSFNSFSCCRSKGLLHFFVIQGIFSHICPCKNSIFFSKWQPVYPPLHLTPYIVISILPSDSVIANWSILQVGSEISFANNVFTINVNRHSLQQFESVC